MLELFQIMSNINVWGLDVFSAADIIKDQRVLTSTTFKIFQERNLLSTFKIDERYNHYKIKRKGHWTHQNN